MPTTETYKGGDNFDLRQVLLHGRNLPLGTRLELFGTFLRDLTAREEFLCMRRISSAADREVSVIDPFTGKERKMLMFGSNNYLGLASHPRVREQVERAIAKYGTGIGGPPLLNGFTLLHRSLEERLAALKGTEDALVFSSGYGANVGLISGIMNPDDAVMCDAYLHASSCDGFKLAGVQPWKFAHNNTEQLRSMLERNRPPGHRDVYVAVEGVYSMDGDLARLDRIIPLCRKHNATLIVDDAHGTGVVGAKGRGTAEHFGVEGSIDITTGTFSKAFAVTGGFVAASRPVVNYLRFFARSYMFSASLPPPVIAAVLAGLDVMESEPERLAALHENVAAAARGLNELGFNVKPQAAIIPLRVPEGMNIRETARKFHQRGIFVNSVEFPAVPLSQQRFRISLMSTHTKEDISKLLTAIEELWAEWRAGERHAAA